MQKFLLSLVLTFTLCIALAQNVGIGTSTPAATAKLDIFSNSSGILVPRLSESERDAIANPEQSLIIYNTTNNCLQFFVGISWQDIACGCAIPDTPGTIGGPTSVCASASGIGFSIAPVNFATSYSWTAPTDASIIAGQGTASISVNFGSSGGDISVTASSACGTSAASVKTIGIITMPEQPSAITGETDPCAGTTETYSVTNDANATQYNWTLPAGWSGTSTTNSIDATAGSTGGTISVTPVNSCGSGTARTLAVTVNTVPSSVNAGASPNPVCEGSSLGLSGSATNAASYSWSGPNSFSSTAQSPSISSASTLAAGDYTLSATNVCGTTTNVVSVAVTAHPGTANNTTSGAAICSYDTKTLGGTPAGGAWSVVSGAGSITGNEYTPVSAGTKTIRYTIAATGGCPATTSDITFDVTADPGAASNTTSAAAICSYDTKALTGTPAGGAWSIVSGGGNIAGITYTPAAQGSKTIRYTIAATGGCPATTADVTFDVTADPGMANNTTTTTAICSYATKTLTGTPAGGSWNVVSGAGSISGNVYTPVSTGSKTIRYTIAATGGCPATTADVTFDVTADPGAASNTTSTATICAYHTKALTGNPAGGSWSVVSGGGGIAGTTYTPASAGSKTIRYTIAATGGCPATTSDATFTVTADPGAATNTTSTATICSNGTKALTGTPAGGSWSIVSGGGGIAGTTYTPASAGSKTIRYTIAATGGCPATTADVTFSVTAHPGTASNTTSNAAICLNATKALTGTPAGGAWSVVSGGGSIGGTTYTPASAGSKTIRYTIAATGGCAATTSDVTFTVNTAGTGTVTYNFTGGQQTWTVPSCVTSMNVDVRGARGAPGFVSYTGATPISTPGYGGRREVTGITVIPGNPVYVYVGGAGGNGSSGVGGAGGWNGGGSGASNASYYGGGGGGASDVRIGGNTLGHRVVVAGGGGGGAGYQNNTENNYGGHGGADVGQNGHYLLIPPTNDIGGGGTQGAGGTRAAACSAGGGYDGALGTGGNSCGSTIGRGGGGGGGYYGGGGARWGGGGGGSNYMQSGIGTSGANQQGYQNGNGQVIISW